MKNVRLNEAALPLFGTAMLVLSLAASPASADETPDAAPAADAGAQDAAKPTGFWERDSLTGDWGGVRSSLEDAGVKLGAIETSEGLADLAGGAKTGAVYEGRTELDLDLDLEKLVGWDDAVIHVNAWQIHGRGLSGNDTKNLLTISGNEADRGFLLSDLYLDQTMWGGLVSLRIGQLASDDEFIVSKVAGLFINSTFGYPGLPSLDQPSGGPDYPFATPAVRLKLAPTDQLTLLFAAFNGDPAGPGTGDPQLRDPSGTAFRLSDGVLGFFEAQYAVNQGKDATGLPATYKLGVWLHSGRFDDLHFDRNGLSLADPRSSGQPRLHDGDWSVYGIVDQMLWRKPDTDDQGLSAFVRLMGAPSDRNLVDFYADGGFSFKGPFDGRGDDLVGLAVAYSRISADASRLDADLRLSHPGRPVRDNESVVELTYTAQVAPWWQLQPDLQYVVHPGGHAPLPTDPTEARAMGNATVLGLRTTITF